MDEVRFGPGLAQRPDQPGGTQEVGLGGKVRRVVELDRGGRVDDDVAAEELLAAGLAEAETVPPEVDLEHRQLLGHELAEALLAELLLQSPEGRAGEDLLIQPVGGRAPGARADGEGHPADLGHRAEQLLHYRLAEEAVDPVTRRVFPASRSEIKAPLILGRQHDRPVRLSAVPWSERGARSRPAGWRRGPTNPATCVR